MLKPKKVYYMKRTPLKRGNYQLKRTALKRSPIKKKPKSAKQIADEKIEKEKMWTLFLQIWDERKRNGINYSEVSGQPIYGEPLTTYFDHLMEKSVYPKYKFCKWNIAILTAEEHTLKTNGFPLSKHQELIDRAIECSEKLKGEWSKIHLVA